MKLGRSDPRWKLVNAAEARNVVANQIAANAAKLSAGFSLPQFADPSASIFDVLDLKLIRRWERLDQRVKKLHEQIKKLERKS